MGRPKPDMAGAWVRPVKADEAGAVPDPGAAMVPAFSEAILNLGRPAGRGFSEEAGRPFPSHAAELG